MLLRGLPKKQGLYDPRFEHDACGIGFIANIKGDRSHEIVRQSLTILINLTHRGGSGSEADTGDGAGLLVGIPHKFFIEECKKSKIYLPDIGHYGVGMLFLPTDHERREKVEDELKKIILEEGLKFLGWRDVPIDDSSLGSVAKKTMPFIRQIFIEKNDMISNEINFDRALYIVRKRAEKFSKESGLEFYAASMSCRTIVYKGMLTAWQVDEFYKDLKNLLFETSIALVHSRYSTNTFPSWERAHPNRYIIHNGEINTLRGNINWITTREKTLKSEIFGENLEKILPIIDQDGSDSAMFDNAFEFLELSGRSLEHSMMMMIPEPWSNHESMSDECKAFYEFHACIMEPWDGPAAMAFTDGSKVGAVLDRNGLRPSRYYVTSDDLVILASEVGVLDLPEDKIICKERIKPGRMLLVDTKQGKIITDTEIKRRVSLEHPYRIWLEKNLIELDELDKLDESKYISRYDHENILKNQKAFGYTYEEIKMQLLPMARDGIESIGSMGIDTPLAVLSSNSRLLYDYFKQLFAQVTNPPIDAIREEIITSTDLFLGTEGDLAKTDPQNCRLIRIKTPVIDNGELEKIRNIREEGFKSQTFPILFKSKSGGEGLKQALANLFKLADDAISRGVNLLILSDRGLDKDMVPIPALLAVSGMHHHLIEIGTRTKVSIVLESGEPREIHHFCLLIGYGATAINPYLAFDTILDMINQDVLLDIDYAVAIKKYTKACVKGIIKVISKMGISTIQSYHGAQIFEAVGVDNAVIDKYFKWTVSRIGGIGIETIAQEAQLRHDSAFNKNIGEIKTLDSGGELQWRKNGEDHLYNPESIYKMQQACRNNDYNIFKEFSLLINSQATKLNTLRGLMEFKKAQKSIPIEEVESVESICKRFKSGAMSYGSISREAHEAIAIAMNRIGGKSNTGEGGEDAERYVADLNGDSRSSAIKQVASGRFGVTSHYLVNSKEIQIKMAQGAKPGEGGQLPGSKVYPWIAKVRHSTPGVSLISPPPHHDIYSIEDLSELVHDLKNANSNARINVKLVSEVGVGTIAAGVAKGRADVVLISGYDGGTGASPRTSIKHGGLPWELGLAETHQTLLLNNLRSRIVVETDGKLLTGRDVAIATLLGAEEYGFATSVLIALGCVMMRVCNLDTCPVGVATQNPELRKRFRGKPEYIVNYMKFIAQELREIMASLGFRTVNEMVGRSDKLEMRKSIEHWKAKGLDLSNIFYRPSVSEKFETYAKYKQDHEIEKSLDIREIIPVCGPALERKEKVEASFKIKNTNRVVGTILGSEISKRYGKEGLPDDTIKLKFYGSAGQSFGAFVPNGVTMQLEGDANDYIGKGICGGKIVVYPPKKSCFIAEENIIIGNVAFYGATSGEAYIRGIAGERFCVRNSGINVVVEGVGDHACEYMTGGRVINLGSTGRNFAAGMSGGIAYVLDDKNNFLLKCNKEMVVIDKLFDEEEIMFIKKMIENHASYTDSDLAKRLLKDWENSKEKFVRVIPNDYKRMVNTIDKYKKSGMNLEDALLAAFEANSKEVK